MVAGRRKLIVVSNRGPVSFHAGPSGETIARRGGGGLATALRGLVSRHEVTWIASAITEEDRRVAMRARGRPLEETAPGGRAYHLRLVTHDPVAYDRYYNVVANPTLWFLHHYLFGLATSPSVDQALWRAWSDGYVAINESFARAVLDELAHDSDACVFFHDYHLYVAPGLVRERAPDALLAHFVHVPWPQPDYWRVLPERIRRSLHHGILANDVVSFHTDRWRRNFLRSCEEIAGATTDAATGGVCYADRLVAVRAAPLSADPSEFDALARSGPVLEEESLITRNRPELLVLRVDRTDPSKNIVRGFRAFELVLESHPELHGRVAMLALLDPSRQDIPEYAEYLGAIERAARALNDRFARPGWLPVDLQIQDNFPQVVAAYKQYDVLLVNAIFDGMNLVAKEAPLVNARDGVLILSENTGAHEELAPWALTVNPFDVAGQAEAIYHALTMAAGERRQRSRAIHDYVREHDLEAWIELQLADIEKAAARLPSKIRP